jgi:hypothetical protein
MRRAVKFLRSPFMVPADARKCVIGPDATAEPIPRFLIWLLCPFTPRAGANGARKRSQIYGPLGMAISFIGVIFERRATEAPLRFCVLRVATLCLLGIWVWDWVTLGSPKGHARATQGSRLHRIGEVPLFAAKMKNDGWGTKKIG